MRRAPSRSWYAPAPGKLNLVAEMIRGKSAAGALADLTFCERRIAGEVKKVVQAAIANAENNHALDVDRLYVAEATVGRALRDEALHGPRPWQVLADREAVQQSDSHSPRARPRRCDRSIKMGQKVNPIGLRVGINRTWDSRWYAGRDYASLLHKDIKLRKYLNSRLSQAGIGKVIIERAANKTRVVIHTAKPGIIIGKKGADIEKLRSELASRAGGVVALDIVEIRKPEIEAKLIAENIAQQLERRVAFRPCHEACRADRDAPRRRRDPGELLGPPRRHGHRPHGMVP